MMDWPALAVASAIVGWGLALAALFQIGDYRRNIASLWTRVCNAEHSTQCYKERCEQLQRELALYGSVAQKQQPPTGAAP